MLSLGEGLGSRVVLHEGSSPFTGGYVIEECEEEEGERLRRLVFLNSPTLAQTVVNIVPGIICAFRLCRDSHVYVGPSSVTDIRKPLKLSPNFEFGETPYIFHCQVHG